ncbi:MAG TPA: hypothetical protein VK726_22110 [Acetobacteraceae bacterium]|jgi:hypothetical protein|nr:hypothetical protein [Acetobacteraceae bacterium]
MRPIALLTLLLTLTGCGGGYNTWHDLPFSTGSNPNLPPGNSENIRRVMGETANVEPLATEPGDVWPGPIQPPPTLEDLETQGGSTTGQPMPPVGSSTPPMPSSVPNMPTLPSQAPSATLPGQSSVTGIPSGQAPQPGQVVPTNQGLGVTTGGTTKYQTIVTPGGGQSIVVPNGNGTSTVIHPDGTVETVPTPK